MLGRAQRRGHPRAASTATATRSVFVEGDDPPRVHHALRRRRSTARYDRIRAIQAERPPRRGRAASAAWPAIVLRTPKGWTGPEVVDGVQVEGTFRAHQVPLAGVRDEPRAPRACSRRGCRATGPRSCSTSDGRSVAHARGAGPERRRADGREPARQRRRLLHDRSSCPTSRDYAVDGRSARRRAASRVDAASSGAMLRDIYRAQRRRRTSGSSAPTRPNSNRLGAVFEVENRCFDGADASPTTITSSPDGRVMEVLSEHNCEGWLEGYLLTGRHGAVRDLRGVRAGRRVDGHAAREVARDVPRRCRGARPVAVAQLPAHVDLLAQRPQRLQPPGPGLHGHHHLQEGRRSRASTCRPTPTACSRWPTTACAAGTT